MWSAHRRHGDGHSRLCGTHLASGGWRECDWGDDMLIVLRQVCGYLLPHQSLLACMVRVHSQYCRVQEWILGLLCVFFYIAPTLGPLLSEPRGIDSWGVCVVKKVVSEGNRMTIG